MQHEVVDSLIGTAWIYYGPPNDGETVHLYYAEVVDVQGDHALLVAPLDYARPARTLRVPIAILTDTYSAFHPLGPASDLAWVQPGRWVVALDQPPTDAWGGIWQIDLVIDAGVFMNARDGRVVSATWLDVRRRFRPATDDEALTARRALFAREREREAAEPRPPPPPVAPPEPTAPTAAPAWTRLSPRVT